MEVNDISDICHIDPTLKLKARFPFRKCGGFIFAAYEFGFLFI